MKAALPPAATQRLATLREYAILDTPPEAEFEEVIKVLSLICDAPVALISLVDEGRQWFKAELGLGMRETSIDASICAHAILQPDLFIVPDTEADPRFRDNPLVAGKPHVRFYAGAPLVSPDGHRLGTVCVLDYKPRQLDDKQRALLRLMAAQVMKTLDLRRALAQMSTLAAENETLAREIDHRVKNSLQVVSALLRMQTRRATGEEAKAELMAAQRRVMAVANVHAQLHQSGQLNQVQVDRFLPDLCRSLQETAPPEITAIVAHSDAGMLASELASTLGLIVAELTANAFRHAYPKGRSGPVEVDFRRTATGWVLTVADEGAGLPPAFDPGRTDGLGMRVIAALVSRLDGTLEAQSAEGRTSFAVSFPA